MHRKSLPRNIVVAVCLAAASCLPPPAPQVEPGAVELVLAATTDVHGRLRGWDYTRAT